MTRIVSSGLRWGLLGLLGWVAACGGAEDSGGPPGAGAKGGPGGGPRGVPGARVPQDTAVVAVEQIERGDIATHYATTATLEPEKEADVLARVPGLIVALPAEEGDRVAAGEMLLQIERDAYLHRLSQAQAEERKQRSRFERLERMLAEELVSTEEFEGTRSDLQAAEAARELAALELSYTRVTAPFAGQIVERHVDVGQVVSNGTVLFRIADTRPLLARIHVPAKEFRRIQVDQPVDLSIDATGAQLEGRITLISPVVDPTTGTIKVTVEIPEVPDGVRPGDFVEVKVVTERHLDAVLVPKLAVLMEKETEVLYVAADSTAQRRVVTTGFRTDRLIEVIDGATAGERVIVQGQRSLEDGQPIIIRTRKSFELEEPAPPDAEGAR